ncbi:uncharacterized protein VTP21DRAFT_11634 [Calcarisporiella thermophila]|uniref:uncharacterized protein n=1 Tax=Calcarisporiella thermophila TaxID=911321 RepID=UPI0037446FAC
MQGSGIGTLAMHLSALAAALPRGISDELLSRTPWLESAARPPARPPSPAPPAHRCQLRPPAPLRGWSESPLPLFPGYLGPNRTSLRSQNTHPIERRMGGFGFPRREMGQIHPGKKYTALFWPVCTLLLLVILEGFSVFKACCRTLRCATRSKCKQSGELVDTYDPIPRGHPKPSKKKDTGHGGGMFQARGTSERGV